MNVVREPERRHDHVQLPSKYFLRICEVDHIRALLCEMLEKETRVDNSRILVCEWWSENITVIRPLAKPEGHSYAGIDKIDTNPKKVNSSCKYFEAKGHGVQPSGCGFLQLNRTKRHWETRRDGTGSGSDRAPTATRRF